MSSSVIGERQTITLGVDFIYNKSDTKQSKLVPLTIGKLLNGTDHDMYT
jgi:hypothetical protein